MASGPLVSVVIPALNEGKNLPHVFARLPPGLHEVIVVDGHPTDDTVAVARRLRPDVRVVIPPGRGKGNALTAGFAACTGDIVVTLDADGSTDPAEIPRFVAALRHGADFVKGSRFAQGGSSSDITLTRRWGNRALNGLVNVLYGTSYTDLCYGFNAFWARCLPLHACRLQRLRGRDVDQRQDREGGARDPRGAEPGAAPAARPSNLNASRDGAHVLCTIGRERMSSRRSAMTRLARRVLAG